MIVCVILIYAIKTWDHLSRLHQVICSQLHRIRTVVYLSFDIENYLSLYFLIIEPETLDCYYCFGHAGTYHDDCDKDIFGDVVACQTQNPRLPNFGDVCYVGHTGVYIFSYHLG